MLDYARRAATQSARLRIGAVSLSLAVVAFILMLVCMRSAIMLRVPQAIASASFWIGLIGLMQEDGRRLAGWGIFIALMASIIMPSY